MPRFFRHLAEGVFDLDDLRPRTHDLAAFVTAASKEHTNSEMHQDCLYDRPDLRRA